MTASLAEIVILADDLSGAAETASTLAAGTPGGIPVLLMPPGGGPTEVIPGPVSLDTDTRYAAPEAAARTVLAIASGVDRGRMLVKKVDSLLRGNFAVELTAMARTGRTVVFAPALPRLDRVVREGRPWVNGAPLAATAAWRLEGGPAPASLLEALPDAVPVALDTVRDGSALRTAVRAASPGSILVCDAETDADLDQLADAAVAESARHGDVALAGSSALAAALGRLLGAPSDSEIPSGAVSAEGRAVFVVGTAEPRARAQVAALRAAGALVLALDPLRLLTGPSGDFVAAVRAALAAPVCVLTLDGSREVGTSAGQLSRRFADVVAAGCSSSIPALLTLTGGETARAVLDALGIGRITVRGTISGGAALATTDAGTTVVTRPGSFGADDDFLRILERVSPSEYARLRR